MEETHIDHTLRSTDDHFVDMNMGFLLNSSIIRMRNPQLVAKKLQKLINGGFDQLMVISDFDYTLSRYRTDDNTRCWTTHGIFEAEASKVDPVLGQLLNDLHNKYRPIEYDAFLSNEDKTPHMEICDECVSLLQLLDDSAVPLILFSAGIGDMISIFIRQQIGYIPANIHLISNMMIFDDIEDCVVGFSEPLIHTFCKNSSVISGERAFFHQLANRHNVLLLGDSLGDLHMDVGVEREGEILKVGFLNFDIDQLTDRYMDGYDIVLIDDQTMHIPMQLLNQIKKGNQRS